MNTQRIPKRESDLVNFLFTTTAYMRQPLTEQVVLTVDAGTTRVVYQGQLPENVVLQLQNTGGVGEADLYFCIGSDSEDACDVLTAISVAQGATADYMVKQLGNPVMQFLKVTNANPAANGSCVVVFPYNWQRLGLLEEQVQEWESRASLWVKAYQDAEDPTKRTPTIISQKQDLNAAFREFAEPVIGHIAASFNLMPTDRDVFNIPETERIPYSRPAITEAPSTELRSGDGCTVRFRHLLSADSKRASIHPDANAVEVRWVLTDVGALPPDGPEECPEVHISTRAAFDMSFGVNKAGKRLYSYSRWRNNSQVQKSGPWNQVRTIVLSD